MSFDQEQWLADHEGLFAEFLVDGEAGLDGSYGENRCLFGVRLLGRTGADKIDPAAWLGSMNIEAFHAAVLKAGLLIVTDLNLEEPPSDLIDALLAKGVRVFSFHLGTTAIVAFKAGPGKPGSPVSINFNTEPGALVFFCADGELDPRQPPETIVISWHGDGPALQ